MSTPREEIPLPAGASDEALREYGWQLAMDGMLEAALAPQEAPAEATSVGKSTRPKLRRSARVHAESTSWRLPALAAAAVLAGVSIYFMRGLIGEPAVLACVISVEQNGADAPKMWRASGQAVALAKDTEIRAGASLEVPEGSTVFLAYPDGSTMQIGMASQVVLSNANQQAKHVYLHRGRLRALVKPQAAPMVLETEQATATVVGTLFSLTCDDARTRLDVNEGRVRLAINNSSEAADVAAGQFAVAVAGQALAVRPGVFVWIEAEDGLMASPMAAQTDAGASGGRFVATSAWFVEDAIPPAGAKVGKSSAETGTATYAVRVPADGQYVLWCRVKARNSGEDSFNVALNGGADEIFDLAEGKWSPEWQWTKLLKRMGRDPAHWYSLGEPRVFELKQGKHTFVFRGREANSKLDCLIFTNDMQYQPSNEAVFVRPAEK